MNQTIHSSEMTLIHMLDWAITLILLVVGLELMKPNLVNLMMLLYRYFIQGEAMSR